MKGLPQNVLLNFRLEFPKSDLTIYLPSGISEIFRQMVSTPGAVSNLYLGLVDRDLVGFRFKCRHATLREDSKDGHHQKTRLIVALVVN